MRKFKFSFLFIILISISCFMTALKADNDDNDDDYDWDFVEVVDGRPKLSKQDIISLTRDWIARENPDTYPTNGFFPVWAFALIIISAFFLTLALITGLLHVGGCKGKRPDESKLRAERRRESLGSSRPSLRKMSLHSKN